MSVVKRSAFLQRRNWISDSRLQLKINEIAAFLTLMAKKRRANAKRLCARMSGDSQIAGISSVFQTQLKAAGLVIREVPGDGNCLFRSLSDQITGNSQQHLIYRLEVCDYLEANKKEFVPFFEDFDGDVRDLRKDGIFAGNESLVAFARLKGVSIVIHQEGMSPWMINCNACSNEDNGGRDLHLDKSSPYKGRQSMVRQPRELHLSFHSNEHYNSLRRLMDITCGPANVRLSDMQVRSQPRSVPEAMLSSREQKRVLRKARRRNTRLSETDPTVDLSEMMSVVVI